MLKLSDFLAGVQANADRVKSYQLGHDGSDGTCDCVGLLIGALRLRGVAYKSTHGSNYFARKYTVGLLKIRAAEDLSVGMIVYKAHPPDDPGYDADTINRKYKDSGDLNDYYHVGVVTQVQPLRITHCSTGGMHVDTRLGKWTYYGMIKGVDYSMQEQQQGAENNVGGGTAIVDVPNDGTLNVRISPKGNAKIIQRIREGTTVNVVGVDGDWAQVTYQETGFVMKKFLREG